VIQIPGFIAFCEGGDKTFAKSLRVLLKANMSRESRESSRIYVSYSRRFARFAVKMHFAKALCEKSGFSLR
jgi:hypothetical protein